MNSEIGVKSLPLLYSKGVFEEKEGISGFSICKSFKTEKFREDHLVDLGYKFHPEKEAVI
jgi:hypothetical protein